MKQKGMVIAVIISLLLHAAILFLFSRLSQFNFDEKADAMQVFLATPENGWKIADIPEPTNQQKPDKSKFLGMYNQKVPTETVRPETVERLPAGKHETVPRLSQDKRGTMKRLPTGKHETSASSGTDLYDFDKKLFASKSSKELNEVVKGSQPTVDSRALEDFYPDYKLGEHTYINVMRYPDIEYFVRLKRIFKMTWDPVSALKRDMAMNSVSHGMVSVVMAVSVDKTGELSELFVIKGSGLAGYDNEALRTVRASSPFTAPPDKFVEKDGVLRMSWTFTLYM